MITLMSSLYGSNSSKLSSSHDILPDSVPPYAFSAVYDCNNKIYCIMCSGALTL